MVDTTLCSDVLWDSVTSDFGGEFDKIVRKCIQPKIGNFIISILQVVGENVYGLKNR
jgi:hypothetical protein